MKRHSLWLVIVVAAALFSGVVSVAVLNSGSKSGAGNQQSKRTKAEPGRVYTFDKAVAVGLVPSLKAQESESKLPLCKPGGTGGYRSAAALKAAVARAPEEPTCMADPRQATFSFGSPGDSTFGPGPDIKVRRR